MVENGSVDDGPGRSLWVGNVNPEEVSERHLVQLFSRCGRVDNVRILPKRFCAFVNYDQAESAALALEKLQVRFICLKGSPNGGRKKFYSDLCN